MTIAIRGKRGRREKEERKGKDKKNNIQKIILKLLLNNNFNSLEISIYYLNNRIF